MASLESTGGGGTLKGGVGEWLVQEGSGEECKDEDVQDLPSDNEGESDRERETHQLHK